MVKVDGIEVPKPATSSQVTQLSTLLQNTAAQIGEIQISLENLNVDVDFGEILENISDIADIVEDIRDDTEPNRCQSMGGYTTAANWQVETDIFEDDNDVRRDLKGIVISPDSDIVATGSTWTIRVYVSFDAAGADDRQLGDEITGIFGTTLPRAVPISDISGYTYIRVTAQSDAANGGDGFDYMYIRKLLE